MKKTILIIAITLLISISAFAFEPHLTKAPIHSKEPFKYLKRENVHRGDDKQNVIKLKLIPLLINTITLQYERTFAENISGACDVNVLFYSQSLPVDYLTSATLTYSGFGLSPEFRFYPGNEAPRGFYVGPYLSYFSMGIKVEGKDSKTGASGSAEVSGMTAMGGGLLLGYQWLIGDVFSIETHIGASFLSLSSPANMTLKVSGQPDRQEPIPSLSFSGFVPTAGLQLGIAF